MSPSKYLGLPWRPWGETDFWLTQGLDELDARICECGCGLFREDCTDPDKEHRMQIVTVKHYGQAVIDDYRSEHGDEIDPGTFVAVMLLPEGETARDPKDVERERAAAEVAAMKARHGLS